MGWLHTLSRVVRNREGYLGCRIPSLRNEGVQAPHRAPKPAPGPGREVPITSACENHKGLFPGETQGCCRPKHLLKCPEHRPHLYVNTFPKLQRRDSQFKKSQGEEQNCLDSRQKLEGQD